MDSTPPGPAPRPGTAPTGPGDPTPQREPKTMDSTPAGAPAPRPGTAPTAPGDPTPQPEPAGPGPAGPWLPAGTGSATSPAAPEPAGPGLPGSATPWPPGRISQADTSGGGPSGSSAPRAGFGAAGGAIRGGTTPDPQPQTPRSGPPADLPSGSARAITPQAETAGSDPGTAPAPGGAAAQPEAAGSAQAPPPPPGPGSADHGLAGTRPEPELPLGAGGHHETEAGSVPDPLVAPLQALGGGEEAPGATGETGTAGAAGAAFVPQQPVEDADHGDLAAPGPGAATRPAESGATGPEAGGPTVPRQKDGTLRSRVGSAGPAGPEPALLPDLLDHPDPAVAAEAATVENLLRCWVRESGIGRPDGPAGTLLRIPLPASGTALLVAVRHWSPAGWHRFAPARLEGAPAHAPALDAVTLASLLAREGDNSGRGGADLVGRVADSVRRTSEFIADRRERPTPPEPVAGDLFLTAEQSLLLGHPLQPDPKSREGLSEAEVRRYSPELHGSFPLHWFAIAPSALATDSAWTERGRPVSAARLLGRLVPGLPLPDGATPLPLHPWQARDLLQRPGVAALRDAGLLHDLGPYGEPWYPTSSVRTVQRPGAPAMLKLSLGLRITNSRRENLRKELHRGVEVHRLLRTGLAEQWQAAHPGFDIVRDPAWIAVDAPDGTPVPGLDTVLRHNPFRSHDDAVCIAALTAPRPWPGRTGMRSRLAETVSRLAATTGRPTSAVAAEWFLRYLEHVVLPVLAFDALAGIALEAHQQNTLVLLDPAGWPVGGRYRDNQGYYFRASRRAELERRLPGIGSASDTFVSDAVTDERFAYYLGINNVLGLIGAFGSQRLADERVLLAAFRRFLGKASGLGPLPARLLDSPTLRCKANLLTRLGGLDELVGPVDSQSVYVTLTNPLHD
ncbi:IucA/IucC family protein [Actinobacteria bacterium OV450]|nr:IucA/IucC family protein [Actinobacteria bacterium OV450]